MPATFKAIKPKPFKKKAIKALVKPIEEAIDEADKLFAQTHKHWRHKPKFVKKIDVGANEIRGSVLTSGDGSKNNPYPFIARGTRVRYATMTGKFRPKTTPGTLVSGRGKGAFFGQSGVAYISKKKRRPGIKARNFEEQVAKIVFPKLQASLDKATAELAKETGHAL